MNTRQAQLLEGLLCLLPEEDAPVCRAAAGILDDLGYVPHKLPTQGYILSYRHAKAKVAIAKLGIRRQRQGKARERLFVAVRFPNCQTYQPRFLQAMLQDIADSNEQYCEANTGGIIPEDSTPKNRCRLESCTVCTCGRMCYYHQYPDGRELLRCGAYHVTLLDPTLGDMTQVEAQLSEQHAAFERLWAAQE